MGWRVLAAGVSFSASARFVSFLALTLLRAVESELPVGAVMAPPLPPCNNSEISVAEECPGGYRAGDLAATWVGYHSDLYKARAALFDQGPAGAVAALTALLTKATRNFSLTFGCLPALLSTYFSLGHALALQGRLRRALAMMQMGFIFARDRGFSECSPWPVQGWDMMLAGKGLTARVRKLDDEAVTPVPASYRKAGLRIAVVTICSYAVDEPVRVLCDENRRLYAALHNYDVHFFTDPSQITPNKAARMDVQDGKHKPFFWKVNAVKNVLETGSYDWVLWMDCDAFFMDPLRTIDSVVTMYSENSTAATRLSQQTTGESQELSDLRRRVAPDPPIQVSIIFAVDSTGINNGVWLLRNSPWSHGFLERWWHSDILDGPGQQHNCSDQSTMVHTLLHERALDVDDAWDSVEAPIWPPEARVAAQEHLQSFHQATAETAMSRAWTEGDFIKHHPGCHYYRVPCQHLYDEAEAIFRNKVLTMHANMA